MTKSDIDKLLDLRRALGILDKRPHEEALLHAKHMAEAVDCMDWADEQDVEFDKLEPLGWEIRLWYPAPDGTMTCRDFTGPDLITVLREAREWDDSRRGGNSGKGVCDARNPNQ